LRLRENYHINVVKIIRGHKEIYFPYGGDFIYPSDQLTVIGTDEQISTFTKLMEDVPEDSQIQKSEIKLFSFVIKGDSPLLGKNLDQSGLRGSGCSIVEIVRGEEIIVNPDISFTFEKGDLVWIAGGYKKIQQFI